MRKGLILLALTIFGLILFSAKNREHEKAAATLPPPLREVTILPPDPSNVDQESVRLLDIAETANFLHSENRSAAEDVQLVASLIDNHLRLLKRVPAGGLNEEIVASLCGKNERRLGLLSPSHPAISPQGELLDRFGTPFYFHPVSKTKLEVRSAGPDRKLFSRDDLLDE